MSPQKPLAGPPGRAALVLIAILSLLILFVLFQRNRIVKEPSNSVLQEEYAAVAPEEEAEQEATPVQVAINITESPPGEWMGTRDGSRFLVKVDGGENAVAGHLIGLLLEEAYIKVGSDLDLRPEGRVEALLYTRERFRDITRSPSWAGAIYDGRIKIPAGGITEKTSELEKVVFHEYTHAVVRDASKGRAPVWLNEGIAQYEEGRSSSEYARILSEIAGTGKVRLRVLEGSFMGLRSEQAQIAYLLSLSATEYIIREFGLFSVRNILENLGKGMGMDEAVSTALGLSYADMERSWLASPREKKIFCNQKLYG